jgi:hypothetical protein
MNRYEMILQKSLFEIAEVLRWHFTSVGLNEDQLRQIVKDLVGIMEYGGNFTVKFLDDELQKLEWQTGLIDETSLCYIISFMEKVLDYKATFHVIQ